MKTVLSYCFFVLLLFEDAILLAQSAPRPPLLDLVGVQAEIFLINDNYAGWDALEYINHSAEANNLTVGVPGEEFLKFESNGGFVNNMYRVNLCFTPFNRKSARPMTTRELKIGASYFPEISNSVTYLMETSGMDDTVFHTSYFYHLESDELAVNGAYLFKTNPDKGVDVFAGVGCSIGHSITSKLNTSYVYSYEVHNPDSINSFHENDLIPIDSSYDDVNAKQSFFLGAHVPLGIEFRVIRRWIVSLEGDAGLNWQIFTNAENAVRFQYTIGLGLKYNW